MLTVSVWWFWPLVMFVFTFFIGLIAPVSGVGGGVLFVPLVTAFFPFNVDFVRGTGLIMTLAGSLSSTPQLVRQGLANLKIMPPLLIVSLLGSLLGGSTGLWITNGFPEGPHYVTVALGVILLIVFVIMVKSKRVEFPNIEKPGPLSAGLGLTGEWYEPSLNQVVTYKVTRLRYGLPAFAVAGFIGGMFGVGAGWASVPALNLIMGAPIKVATSTSTLIITANSAVAAWVYLANGAVLPLIVVPSVAGIAIGARLGAAIAVKARPSIVRYLVMGILLLAALLDIVKGLGGLGLMPKIL